MLQKSKLKNKTAFIEDRILNNEVDEHFNVKPSLLKKSGLNQMGYERKFYYSSQGESDQSDELELV